MNIVVSIVCLSIVGALCTVGVFHPLYRDTLGERIGMSLIGVWCLARVGAKLAGDWDSEPVHLLLHVGLFTFAVALAQKKYMEHRLRSVVV